MTKGGLALNGHKGGELHSVTHLKRTSIFEWGASHVWLVVDIRMDTRTCLKKENLLTNRGLIVNKIGVPYMII